MTSRKGISTTADAIPAGGWQPINQAHQRVSSTDTRGPSSEGLLLVQGRYVAQDKGGVQLVVTVDPAAIDRKIAIRRVNDQIEGRTLRSNTLADTKFQR